MALRAYGALGRVRRVEGELDAPTAPPVGAGWRSSTTATAAGPDFHEVYVSTPLEECERRDPKGLYARARAGRLPGFTGVDAQYEAPERPDVEFDTSAGDGGEDPVGRLLARLGV